MTKKDTEAHSEAHRENSCVHNIAGLAEVVLEDLPGCVVGQVVDVHALAH